MFVKKHPYNNYPKPKSASIQIQQFEDTEDKDSVDNDIFELNKMMSPRVK